ncbi:hypothetical protein DPMN_178335 [Dreissena polymorpha]|uniref:Uncharacterized protein n=1 Tax=Dreissena polymorpha TaxID=45954 RepID=A0A9D4IIK7_DREPO|nr:hypothetical protein DPMN_178335 [Dreissena polymorpha]
MVIAARCNENAALLSLEHGSMYTWECKRKTALLEQVAGFGSARERLLYLSKWPGLGVQEKHCST